MARPPPTRKQDTPLRRALQVSRALRAQTTPKSRERMAARVCKLENPPNPSGSQYQSPGKHTTPEAPSPEPVLLYHRATQHSKAQRGFASPTPPTWKDLPNSTHCLSRLPWKPSTPHLQTTDPLCFQRHQPSTTGGSSWHHVKHPGGNQ